MSRRTLTLVAVLSLFSISSWWLAQRTVTPTVHPENAEISNSPDYIIENFSASIMDTTGRQKYLLKAQRLEHYPNRDGSQLTRPLLTQYPKNGAPTHTRADNGWMPSDESHIEMNGNVRVTHGADTRSAGGEIVAETMKVLLDK